MTVSLRPLAWTRIGLALITILRTTPLIRMVDPTLGAEVRPLLGWPQAGLQLAAPGMALPADVIRALCVVRTLALVSLLVGYRSRWSAAIAGVAGYVVVLQNAFGFTFTQHLMFVSLFALAFTDCGAELAVRRDTPRAPVTSYWLVWLLTTSVYFWAAVAKFRRDWFDGRTLGLFYDEGKLRGPLASLFAGTAERRALSGPLVVLTELALVPLLLFPRTRGLAFLGACAFHGVVEGVARPDVFGWLMVALLLSFAKLP